MVGEKDWFDTAEYIDQISIDVRRDYLSKHFLDLYQLKIKTREIIQDLPKFKVKVSVRSRNWAERVQEEYEIFDILKKRYIERIGFAVFENLKTVDSQSRRWTARFNRSERSRGVSITIMLSLTYPRSFPTALKNVGDRHLTPGAKCFGDLKMRWDKSGSMGIPHFLVIIGYYFAIERQSIRI